MAVPIVLWLALLAHLRRKHVVSDIYVWTRRPPNLSMQPAWIISLRAFLAGCFMVAQCECSSHSCITHRRGVSDRWRGRQNLSAGAMLWLPSMEVGLKPTQLWAVLLLKKLHIYCIVPKTHQRNAMYPSPVSFFIYILFRLDDSSPKDVNSIPFTGNMSLTLKLADYFILFTLARNVLLYRMWWS